MTGNRPARRPAAPWEAPTARHDGRRRPVPVAAGSAWGSAACGRCWSRSHAAAGHLWSRAWPRPEPWPGGLGLALATLLVGALTIIRLRRRARAKRGAGGKSEEAELAVAEIPPR